MKLIKYPSKEQWAELLKRPALNTENLFDTVRAIINKVRAEGDKAVLEYEAAFDKVTLSSLAVTTEEIKKADELVSDELKAAISLAKRNIETFHSSQRFVGKKVETMNGVTCWQKAVGIEKVGLYIPGGTAPLFSFFSLHSWRELVKSSKQEVCKPLLQWHMERKVFPKSIKSLVREINM